VTTVDLFQIRSASGPVSLEFFDLVVGTDGLAMSVCARLTGRDLHAAAEVEIDARDLGAPPSSLFVEMGRQWNGWKGELSWCSHCPGLALKARHDGRGHIPLRVELGREWYEDDWLVHATVMIEAGQLEDLARRAMTFFEPNRG
jgi:hypothetical protein